jgi:DNA polymerase-3 subunit delta'|tara:strand:+ start:1729 stop:2715 length:987 start_codon:yes stop_codon:yes gene_type:complete
MSIDKYDWLQNIYNQVNFINLPHGIIINGPSGIGKKILAKAISQKIIANFQEDLDSQNQSLFTTNHHPDFYLLDRDKIYLKDIIKQKKESKYWDEEKGYKDVVSFLTLTPSISKNKVVCIMNADTMNEESQNALLKSLEEPASYSYIIMTTSRPKSLNQTIYSRCQVLNIPHLPSYKIDEWLNSYGVTDYSSNDFPSYTMPLNILDDIQSDKHNSYKEFILIINQFVNLKIDQGQAIKYINDLDINFISKINYFVEFLKILLKSKLTNESLSGSYKNFNSTKFSNLKISNIIVELNDLRHDFYDVSSINETHVLNYFCSELKQSIRQQ